MSARGHRKQPNYTPLVWGLGLFALVLVYSLLFGRHGLPQVAALEATARERSAEAYDGIATNAALRERLDGLKYDDRALEEEARSSLGFVHPDEVVFILRQSSTSTPR